MKKLIIFTLAMVAALNMSATAETYTLLKDASLLTPGIKFVIACTETEKVACAMGESKYFEAKDALIEGDKLTTEEGIEITLGGTEGAWTLTTKEGPVKAKSAKALSLSEGVATWKISIAANGNATIESTTSSYGLIQYNTKDPRFLNYLSTATNMAKVQIYAIDPTAPVIKTDRDNAFFTARILDGVKVTEVNDNLTLKVTLRNIVGDLTISPVTPGSAFDWTYNAADSTLNVKAHATTTGNHNETIVISGKAADERTAEVSIPVRLKVVESATAVPCNVANVQVCGDDNFLLFLGDSVNNHMVNIDLYTGNEHAITGGWTTPDEINIADGYTKYWYYISDNDSVGGIPVSVMAMIEYMGKGEQGRRYTIAIQLTADGGIFEYSYTGAVYQYEYALNEYLEWDVMAVDVLFENEPTLLTESNHIGFGNVRQGNSDPAVKGLKYYAYNLTGVEAKIIEGEKYFSVAKQNFDKDSDVVAVTFADKDLALGSYTGKLQLVAKGTNSTNDTIILPISVRYIAKDANDFEFEEGYFQYYAEDNVWDVYMDTKITFDSEGYIIEGASGAETYFSIITASQTNFCGTYTLTEGDDSGLDNYNEYWPYILIVEEGNASIEYWEVGSTIKIESNGDGRYRITYNIIGNSGNTYKGTVIVSVEEATWYDNWDDDESTYTVKKDITDQVSSWANETQDFEAVTSNHAVKALKSIRHNMVVIDTNNRTFNTEGKVIK